MCVVCEVVCDVCVCRSVLFGQWGFGSTEQQGLTCLFHGAPGTGKSLAAEAIGYEVGKPLKVATYKLLLSLYNISGGQLWRTA